jgi:Domain of unknown function (DUF4136)
MKATNFLTIGILFLVVSCASVHVNADYDKTVNFAQYKTYAYHKAGIDKVEISDLDKKRILRSVDEVLLAKGFMKSETPDLLVNIFTKEREEVNVNQFNNNWGYGWGFGWNPFWGMGMNTSVTTQAQGTLYIDLIDAAKKEMIWQGQGDGYLTQNVNKKDERIKEFVTKILEQYPPKIDAKK